MTARLSCTWYGIDDVPVDAPVLVLGNSIGTNQGMWAPLIPEFVRRFRVLAVETRGHAGSEVLPGPYTLNELGGDFLAVLDEIGISTFRYAGLSLGGMIGMWLAAHAPQRVERMALVCTSAYLPPATAWIERAETVRSKGTGAIAGTVAGRWFTEGFREREPERVAAAVAMLEATPDEGYAACCEAIAGMDLRPDLSRITADTLVIAGADDPATPPSHAEAIVESVPRARLQIVPDAAHLATLEQPDTVATLITAHLGGAQ
ncbi:3-oxoadipate enol-lactonase [Cryptosporangium aurantiacum]|uniref:3-oxoadipate enol-lactonase n=1 Tax=Cryptosporangium aurantiacum TaxID=134849 RepID=A0A1M7QSY7_9ACTN|nr:3-oxoadipate enol-lactonase [Cryptosporangium aurantiacum]SHN34677.1 3-oxoadipate enol-lactonase [Cryptosporangium aurantiacum]